MFYWNLFDHRGKKKVMEIFEKKPSLRNKSFCSSSSHNLEEHL